MLLTRAHQQPNTENDLQQSEHFMQSRHWFRSLSFPVIHCWWIRLNPTTPEFVFFFFFFSLFAPKKIVRRSFLFVCESAKKKMGVARLVSLLLFVASVMGQYELTRTTLSTAACTALPLNDYKAVNQNFALPTEIYILQIWDPVEGKAPG